MFKKTLALLVVVTLAGCVEPAVESRPENVTFIQLSSSEYAAVQRAVRSTLIDPESARFGPYRAARVRKSDGSTETIVCGYVNSRNRMGGYAGNTPYIADQVGSGVWVTGGPARLYDEVCQRMYGFRPPSANIGLS